MRDTDQKIFADAYSPLLIGFGLPFALLSMFIPIVGTIFTVLAYPSSAHFITKVLDKEFQREGSWNLS